MNITQHQMKAANLEAIKRSLGANERIACTNAVVVVDDDGNVRAWFDNDTPVCFIDKEEDLKEVFAKRLKHLREERKGLSRRVLSQLCGLGTGAVYKYETGQAAPALDSLVALAEYFDVSVDYLCGRTDNRK